MRRVFGEWTTGVGVAAAVVVTAVGVTGAVWGWEVHPAIRIPIRITKASKLPMLNFLEVFMWQIKANRVI
jgi:hypothetical protein